MTASDWSERTRMMVTIGVGVAVNVALGYFLYAGHGKFADLDKKNKGKQVEADKLRVEVQKKKSLQTRLSSLQRDLTKKESLLPEQQDDEKLNELISERAQQSGASLLASSRSAPSTESGPGASYERTVFKTRWQADFMSWCKLMNSMEEKFPRLVAFENLVLTPSNNGVVPMGYKHDISVDVIVYRYLRQQQP